MTEQFKSQVEVRMIDLLKSINLLYFAIAFAVGMFAVYVSNPPPSVVVKFPSPYNAGKVLYKDKNDACYRYKASKVACPSKKDEIKQQPLFEDFRL